MKVMLVHKKFERMQKRGEGKSAESRSDDDNEATGKQIGGRSAVKCNIAVVEAPQISN